MKYTVTWKPATKDQLAEIWMAAPDRAAVSTAANAIDRLLRDNAENEGEARGGISRILIVEPLIVAYDLHELDRRIDVLSVRHVPARPS
jgi:plasmid stabilization system protein ParE